MGLYLRIFCGAPLVLFVLHRCVCADCSDLTVESVAEFRRGICKRSLPEGKTCMCSTNSKRVLQAYEDIPNVGWVPQRCATTMPRPLLSKGYLNSIMFRFMSALPKKQYMMVLINPSVGMKPNVSCEWAKTNIPGSRLNEGMTKILQSTDVLPFRKPSSTSGLQVGVVRRYQIYLFETPIKTLANFVGNDNRAELNWVKFLNSNKLCNALVGGYQMNIDDQHVSTCNPESTCHPACGKRVLCLRFLSCGDALTPKAWRTLQKKPTVTYQDARQKSRYQITIFINDGTRNTLVWNLINVDGLKLFGGTNEGEEASPYRIPKAFKKNKYTIHAHLREQLNPYKVRQVNVTMDELKKQLHADCHSILASFRIGYVRVAENQMELDSTEELPDIVNSGPGGISAPHVDYRDETAAEDQADIDNNTDNSGHSINYITDSFVFLIFYWAILWAK